MAYVSKLDKDYLPGSAGFRKMQETLSSLSVLLQGINSHVMYLSSSLDWLVAPMVHTYTETTDTWLWLSVISGGHPGFGALLLSSVITLLIFLSITCLVCRRRWREKNVASLRHEQTDRMADGFNACQGQGHEGFCHNDGKSKDGVDVSNIQYHLETTLSEGVSSEEVTVEVVAPVTERSSSDDIGPLSPHQDLTRNNQTCHHPLYTAASPTEKKQMKKNQKTRNRIKPILWKRSRTGHPVKREGHLLRHEGHLVRRESLHDKNKTYMIVMMQSPLPSQIRPPFQRPTVAASVMTDSEKYPDLDAPTLIDFTKMSKRGRSQSQDHKEEGESTKKQNHQKASDEEILEGRVTSCNTITHDPDGRIRVKRIRSASDAKHKAIHLRGGKKSRADDSTCRVERKSRIMLTRESTFLVNETRPEISQPKAKKVFLGNPKSRDAQLSDFPTECISKSFSLKKTETPVLNSLLGEGAFRCYSKNNWSKTNKATVQLVTSQSTDSIVSITKENLTEKTESFNVSPKKYTFDAIKTFQESVYHGYHEDHDGVLGNIGRHNTKFLTERGQTSSNDLSSNNDDVTTADIPRPFYTTDRSDQNMMWTRDIQNSVKKTDADNGGYFVRTCRPATDVDKNTALDEMLTKKDNNIIHKYDKRIVNKRESQKIVTENLDQETTHVPHFETNEYHENVSAFKSIIFQNHCQEDDDSKQVKHTQMSTWHKTSLYPQNPKFSSRRLFKDNAEHVNRWHRPKENHCQENIELCLDTAKVYERTYESNNMDKGHVAHTQKERLDTNKNQQYMQEIDKSDLYFNNVCSSAAQHSNGLFIDENKLIEPGHGMTHSVPTNNKNQTMRYSGINRQRNSISSHQERGGKLLDPLTRDSISLKENSYEIPSESLKQLKLKCLKNSTYERIVPRTLAAGDSKDVGADQNESPNSENIVDSMSQKQNVLARQCRGNMEMNYKNNRFTQIKQNFTHLPDNLSNPVSQGVGFAKSDANSSILFNNEKSFDPKFSFQGWKVKQYFYTGQEGDLNYEKKFMKVNEQNTINKNKTLGLDSSSAKVDSENGYRKCRSFFLKRKDADWHCKDKLKIRKQRCFGHVVKKSKSLISVGHLLSQLTYKPVKMTEKQHKNDDVLVCGQGNPAYSAASRQNCNKQPYSHIREFCDVRRPADQPRDNYVKCTKSRKAKRHRHEPYRKQILSSSDSTASPGHQVIRNRNNCSPSRRGRYVKSPQVDQQFFGGELSSKYGHRHADNKGLEFDKQLFFTKSEELKYTEQTCRSYSGKDGINVSEINESGEIQCQHFDNLQEKNCEPRQTIGDDWNTSGPFDRGEHHSFEIRSKDVHKISETSDTFTRSETQSSSNFTNPNYTILTTQPPSIHCHFSKQGIGTEWAVDEQMPSSISRGDEDSYMSTRDGVSNKMTQAQSMTQSHTTQTDATFLTNSVDVQTSPRLAIGENLKESHLLMTSAGVQTSPQFENTGKRGALYFKRKSLYQTSKISKERIKSSKFTRSLRNKQAYRNNPASNEHIYRNNPASNEHIYRNNPASNEHSFVTDFFSREMRSNIFSDKSSEAREENQNSTSSLEASGSMVESVSHRNNSEGIHFNISHPLWVDKEESTNKDNDEKDNDEHSNINSDKTSAFVEDHRINVSMTQNTESSFAVNDIFLFKGNVSDQMPMQDCFEQADQKSKLLLKGSKQNDVLLTSNQHVSKPLNIPLPPAIDVTVLNQNGEISETSIASSKLTELKNLCVVRPSWKNANIDEIDRRVKRALRLREELQKQKTMSGHVGMKLTITDEDDDSIHKADCSPPVKTRNTSDSIKTMPVNFTNSRLFKRDPHNDVHQEALFDIPEENKTVLSDVDKDDASTLPEQEYHRSDEILKPDILPKRDTEAARKPSAANATSVFPYEKDSSDSDVETVQTKPYSDNVVTSSQASASNIEQNTLKRARAKDKNSPPTKISKVENALTKPVNQVGELVSCLPQVPLASFVEWFIETSDPNSYVSSDHSSNSSGKEREERVSGNDVNSSVSDDLSCYVHYKGKTTKLSPAPFLDAMTKTPTGAVKFSITTRSTEEKTSISSEFKNLVAMDLAAVSSGETRLSGQELKQSRDQSRVNEKYIPEGHMRHVDDKTQYHYRQLHVEQHQTRFQKEKKVEARVSSCWSSPSDGDDAVVVSEVSASASGTTVTQLDNCSTVRTPTVQLAYENYSDEVSPSFIVEEETVSSVDTCTAGDRSVFLDESGSASNVKFNAKTQSSNETKERSMASNKVKSFSSGVSHSTDVLVTRKDEDKRCPPPSRGHILMNIRKATDGQEVGRFDRTRIRLLKSSDLTGIITKVQNDDS